MDIASNRGLAYARYVHDECMHLLKIISYIADRLDNALI